MSIDAASFTVVYDTSALYGNLQRDLLIRVARSRSRLVRAKWTDDILDELFIALARRSNPRIPEPSLGRLRSLIERSVEDWRITGHLPLVDALDLPDPDDRHVLAAAIKARAQVIVTENLRDFPEASLAPWDIRAKHPDAFLADIADLRPGLLPSILRDIADERTRPPNTPEALMVRMEELKLLATVGALREAR